MNRGQLQDLLEKGSVHNSQCCTCSLGCSYDHQHCYHRFCSSHTSPAVAMVDHNDGLAVQP